MLAGETHSPDTFNSSDGQIRMSVRVLTTELPSLQHKIHRPCGKCNSSKPVIYLNFNLYTKLNSASCQLAMLELYHHDWMLHNIINSFLPQWTFRAEMGSTQGLESPV